MIWIIILAVWLVGAIVAYYAVISKWEGKSTFDKIWFSIFWPVLLILYPIHWCYNKLKD